MNILIAIIVGGIAGWIASNIMKADTGILLNIGLGIVGAIVASFLFGLLGITAGGFIGNLIFAIVGACIVIWGVRKLRN